MKFKDYLAEATEDKKLENGFIKKTINAIVQNKLLDSKDNR